METEAERSRSDDSESRRRRDGESRRRTPRPDRGGDDDQGARDQGKREKVEKAAKEAVKLKEGNARLRKLRLDQQIAEGKDDLRRVAIIQEDIREVERQRNQIASRVSDELGVNFLITSLEDFSEGVKAGQLGTADRETLRLFEEEWLTREKAAIAAKDAARDGENYQLIQTIDGLIERKKAELARLAGSESEIAYGQLARAKGEEDFYNLLKDLPPEEQGFLVRYYQQKLDAVPGIKNREGNWRDLTPEEQGNWFDEQIYKIRNLSMDPSLIMYTPLWRELLDRLADENTEGSQRDKWNAHLNLLRFNLGCRTLKDPNIEIKDIARGLSFLDKSTVSTLLKSEEIRQAFDLFGKTPEAVKITSSMELDKLILEDKKDKEGKVRKSLIKQLLEKKGINLSDERIQKPVTEEEKRIVREVKGALYSAVDLYYFFGSFQAVEASGMRPDAINKVLHFVKWMDRKFRPPFIEALGRERFYRKNPEGKLESVIGKQRERESDDEYKFRQSERQVVGLGVEKPLHNLFQKIEPGDFKTLGFDGVVGQELFDFQGRACGGFNPENKEKTGKSYLYYKGEGDKREEIEVVFKPTKEGKASKQFVVVRVANIKAETLGKVFTLSSVDEKWIGDYASNNLEKGENTRLEYLSNGLLEDPVGSSDMDTRDPLGRLAKALGGGKFLSNMGYRALGDAAPFELAREDIVELYLSATEKWFNQYGKDNQNLVVGGDSLRSILINEARIKGMITKEGEDRLTAEVFGGYGRRYLRRTVSQWPLVAAMRYPGMKLHLVGAAWDAFKDFFMSYVFEGTPLDGLGGKPKPKK